MDVRVVELEYLNRFSACDRIQQEGPMAGDVEKEASNRRVRHVGTAEDQSVLRALP